MNKTKIELNMLVRSRDEIVPAFEAYTAEAIEYYLSHADIHFSSSDEVEFLRSIISWWEDEKRLSKKQIYYAWKTISRLGYSWIRKQDAMLVALSDATLSAIIDIKSKSK